MFASLRLARPASPLARLYLACGAVAVGLADAATGPEIHFPILYTVPVGLAAWWGFPRLGAGFAAALSLLRFGLERFVWASLPTAAVAGINGVIRLLVLLALCLLLYQTGRAVRQVVREVELLEGILPICSYCKRIRDEQQHWQPLEAYIGARSAAQFSHSICPSCMEEHHAELMGPDGTP